MPIRDALQSVPYVVSKVDEAEKLDKADPPFKTSTLQQQAAIRLRFSGKRTMKIAQELYEGIDVDGSGPVGLITYMRTDSLRISDEAMTAVRERIKSEYGDRYLPAKPIRYAAGKMAQEAHEAIRPTDLNFSPDRIKGHLSHDQFRLYQLIYARFLASQMSPAIFTVTDVAIAAGQGVFKAQGKVLKFDGHRRVWPPGGKMEDELLPAMAVGQNLDLHALDATQHFTQPAPRYSEATLIKALEKEAIGRPSTYAPIIQTIQDRSYVEQKERRFYATDLGMVVTDFLVEQLPQDSRPEIHGAHGRRTRLDRLGQGGHGQGSRRVLLPVPGCAEDGRNAGGAGPDPDRRDLPRLRRADGDEVRQDRPVPGLLEVHRTDECKATRPMGGTAPRRGRREPARLPQVRQAADDPRKQERGEKFLSCSGYPDCKESFNIDKDGNPVPSVVETEYTCEKCGKPMAMRQGSRGSFLGCTGYPKCRNAMPVDDQGRPIPPVKVEMTCEKCGEAMAVRSGRRGSFLGCTGYPKCRGTAPVPDELKEQLAEQQAAAAPAESGVDLKTIVVEETCEQCGGAMVVRRSKRGFFLGCAKYPKCKGTRQPERAHAREDQRGRRHLNRLPVRRYSLSTCTHHAGSLATADTGVGEGRPSAIA